MKLTVIAIALLTINALAQKNLADPPRSSKPVTCYWYSHDQHIAAVNQGKRIEHARLIRVNGKLKMYTAARASQDGTCKPPTGTEWHDWELIARDPGDRVESVEPQPRVK